MITFVMIHRTFQQNKFGRFNKVDHAVHTEFCTVDFRTSNAHK